LRNPELSEIAQIQQNAGSGGKKEAARKKVRTVKVGVDRKKKKSQPDKECGPKRQKTKIRDNLLVSVHWLKALVHGSARKWP